MGRKCVGGQLDGMAVFIPEDVNACVLGGGAVVSTGDGGGGCGASSVAAMSSRPESNSARQASTSQALASFRKVRASSGEHPVVQAAIALNSLAAPEIERIGREDREMQIELAMALQTVGSLVQAVTDSKQTGEKYERKTHAHFVELGRRISELTEDTALKQGIAFLLSLVEPMVGKPLHEIQNDLARFTKKGTSDTDPKSSLLVVSFPSRTLITAADRVLPSSLFSDVFVDKKFPSVFETIAEEARATKAIAAKARALGWLGNPKGDGEFVTGGYRQQFENADVYVGANGIAYEVHGDILRKYNFLHGPDGSLGLPITDETGTPDGIGRYNHFEHGGSIYWTPTTGPMMVGGVIRNVWSSQGWENGPLGYPVEDEYRLPGLYPPDKPNLAWSKFQNGTVFAQGNAAARALAAEIPPDALKSLVRTFFDRRLHDAGQDLGLEAEVDLVEISGWSYGFLSAVPRSVTYRLYGFHSNPIIADTTFEITIRLRFGTAWPLSFAYPSAMSLVVALDWLSVHADGAGSGQIANGIYNGIEAAFNRGSPQPDHPEVPNGAIFVASFPTNVDQRGLGNLDVINVLTTAQGGLQVLVNPLPPSFGGIRRNFAQSQIDGFLENF